MIEKEPSETVTPKRFYAVERYQSEIFLSSFNLMSGTSSGFSYSNIDINNFVTVTMQGCAVAIDEGKSITVKSGGTLIVTNSGNSVSNLFACEKMWKGIIVDAGGTLKILNGSTISDAEKAVSADGAGGVPIIKLYESNSSRVFFDHNIYDLYLTNGDFSASSIFRADFLCTGGVLTKHNYTGSVIGDCYGFHTKAHIYLNKVNSIVVGQSSGQGYNTFSDADYGILADAGTYLYAYHNNFGNIGQTSINITGNSQLPSFLKAGNNPSGQQNYVNTFNKSGIGISCLGEVRTTIYQNDFSNCDEDAIVIAKNFSKQIDVLRNTIDNCHNGISMWDITTPQQITIDSNIISGGLDARGIPSNLHGIDLYNGFTYKIPLQITRNRITDYPYGIRLMNVWVNNSFVVAGNEINFNLSEDQLGGKVYRGIFMSNCLGAKVASNIILWNSGLIIPADINAHAYDVQGLRMEHVQSSDIKDNTVTTCGTGMFLYDDCSGTYFTCNNFQDNYPGIEFRQTMLPPAQGGLCQPAFNTWNGTYSAAFPKNIATGICSFFSYYYSGTLSFNNPENPMPGPNIINPFNIGNCVPINPCTNNHNGNLMADDTTKKDEELEKIVDQPAPTPPDDFASETEYKKQEYAYSTMQEIPALINSADRVDFMDSTGQNNIGKLKEVKDLMLAGDLMQAATKNNLIVDSNLIESYKKTANNINLSTDTITASDSIVANGIANQLAIQGGEAVYWMRGRLRKDTEDVLPVMRKAKIVGDESKPVVHGKLFPIPATETVTFSYEHPDNKRVNIIVADALGQALRNYILNNSTIEFSLSDLSNGFYYVKVCEDGIEKEEHKLTIIR